MINGLSFDVEDWFQVENLKPAIPATRWDGIELRVEANTRKILALLHESGTKATFFVLGWIAERCPELVREIDRQGHEVASHGFGHQLVYEMTREAFREDLLRSKRILEAITGKAVLGYRAPSFSITPASQWALDILKECGFEYDSSIFPISVHDRYGFPGADSRPFRWPNGLLEIPLAVLDVGGLRLPAAGGGYFRLFPYRYFEWVFQYLNRKKTRFTFYLHPWELDAAQPRVPVPWRYRFRHYVNLHKTERRLRRIVRRFSFSSIATAYRPELERRDPGAHERIRIAFMIDQIDSERAGTEKQLLGIIRGLNREAFQITLICLRSTSWLEEHRGTLDCRTEVVGLDKLAYVHAPLRLMRLIALLRRTRPDVVHAFFPVANSAGVICAWLAGVPKIVSSRRDYGEWMNRRYLAATWLANHLVDRVVANSRPVKELTERREGLDGNCIEVIYNGIEVTSFTAIDALEPIRKDLGIAPGDKVVGIVANFRPMKRHATFVRAAAEILRQRQDVVFVLVGRDVVNAPLSDSVRLLADSLGIADQVRFVGSQGDVARYLAVMDVGVNCSQGEGLSNAIMEYMAFGVPCVVSNSGGNPDLILSEDYGLLFPLDDHSALARQIMRLLEDPALRTRVAANAKHRIKSEMSLASMLSRYESFYQRLIARDSPTGPLRAD